MARKIKQNINHEAADRAVSFIKLLKHTKDKWAGVPFNLMPWQENEILRPLFGCLNKDGLRQYRTCYVEIPRKNGKSEIAAAIALYLLFADGQPGAEIYSAAADRDQASLVFNVAAQMIRQSPALLKRCKIIDSQKRIVVHKTASFYRAISSEAYSKHGFNPSGIIFDEVHAQPNRDLWDVLTTATGARSQPLTFAVTTAGYDRNSICYELHDYGQKILKRVVDDPTFLPVIYSADEDADWTDEKVWAKANPGLGSFRNIDEMRQMCKRAQETPALEMTFRRLYLNQWTNSEVRWMSMSAWDATACMVVPEDLKGRRCYAGLDLSSTTDLTALVLIFPIDDGTYQVIPHFWIPKDTMLEKEKRDRVPYGVWVKQGLVTATDGNVIDYKSIQERLRRYRDDYDIQEIAFDRWGATKLAQDLIDDGFTMVEFGQGFASMSSPTKELMNLVLSRKLIHGGNPVLRWNADNLVVKQDPAGNIKPDKSKSTNKIDGMVALVMALDRAIKHQDDTSVYEQRGMRSLL